MLVVEVKQHKSLRAPPSSPDTCTSLPVSLPQQGREEISAVDVALYTEFLSAGVIKGIQALILLDHRTPLDLMSLLLQELQDKLCVFTDFCLVLHRTMQGHTNSWEKLPLDFALENPVIQWEREAIKISSFHNFASQGRQGPHKEGLYDLEGERKVLMYWSECQKTRGADLLPYLWR